MSAPPTIFVVDDDMQVRQSVSAMVRAMGLPVEDYESAEKFLAAFDNRPGCVVADQGIAGASGLELLEELPRRGRHASIVLLAAKARTPLVVKAMKLGAITVLDKPYDENDLWTAIRDGLAADAQRRQREEELVEIRRRLESLTKSEEAVLELVLAGKANKVIASQLGASLRTIESRRHGVFAKLGVNTVAELARQIHKARGTE